MSYIINNVYMGSQSDAYSGEYLKEKLGITHILTVDWYVYFPVCSLCVCVCVCMCMCLCVDLNLISIVIVHYYTQTHVHIYMHTQTNMHTFTGTVYLSI